MSESVSYRAPTTAELTEDDVRDALDFLVAVEPDPPVATRAEYEAVTARYRNHIEQANDTLRRYAGQIEPPTLEAMREAYYSFTNDVRYLTSTEVSANVSASLNEAWSGIGPWRR